MMSNLKLKEEAESQENVEACVTKIISEKEYLYALLHIPVLGAATIQKMLEAAGSFEAVYHTTGKEFADLGILKPKNEECFDQEKIYLDHWRRELASLEKRQIRFVSPLDSDYPQRLYTVQPYPMGLYVKGDLPREDLPTAAIVGARNCSAYGNQIAEFMGKILSQNGIQIISGLALGIDGAAHRGAISAGQPTFGILGCGVNICYPKENYPLYQAMSGCGGVISECNLSEQPQAKNFPMRNRIISGLADVILVIEAKEKSGSLITARLGLDQGKEIFALPGRITDALSRGCNELIKDGANVLTTPENVIEYLGISREKILRVRKINPKTLAKEEKMVYSCLDLEPKFLEQILTETGLPVDTCMSVLLELELAGYITQPSRHCYGKKIL